MSVMLVVVREECVVVANPTGCTVNSCFFAWQRRRDDSWRVTWHNGIGEVLWVVYVAGVKLAHARVEESDLHNVALNGRLVTQWVGAQQRGNGQVCVKGAQLVQQASGLPAIWSPSSLQG